MAFDFEKLEVYKKALEFANEVYNLTKGYPKDELFGMVSQIRRAAVSISLNIAEGSDRSKKEFKHYVLMARTSAQECIPLLKLASLQGYITNEQVDSYYRKCEELSKMLCGLYKSL
jgi:four helix bundle protein